jgi:glutathione synthase/RimK-type ligase-like ATP-grasp enzyme
MKRTSNVTKWLYTGGRPSDGAKLLAEHPGFKRCITGRDLKPGDTIINWGSSADINPAKVKPGVMERCTVLNIPRAVAQAANKLLAFQGMDEKAQLVPWTADQKVAQAWSDDGKTVVVRNKLTGHSGEGIIIVEPHAPVPAAPLYTRYIFKQKEFRVHVVAGKVVDTQRKIRDPAREPANWKVRSHENGFIYARDGVEADANRNFQAIEACKALKLDFGAVDIVQDKNGAYFVLEINTGPGLEGQTVENYAEAFANGGNR